MPIWRRRSQFALLQLLRLRSRWRRRVRLHRRHQCLPVLLLLLLPPLLEPPVLLSLLHRRQRHQPVPLLMLLLHLLPRQLIMAR